MAEAEGAGGIPAMRRAPAPTEGTSRTSGRRRIPWTAREVERAPVTARTTEARRRRSGSEQGREESEASAWRGEGNGDGRPGEVHGVELIPSPTYCVAVASWERQRRAPSAETATRRREWLKMTVAGPAVARWAGRWGFLPFLFLFFFLLSVFLFLLAIIAFSKM